MNISHPLKAIIIGSALTLLAGCQSPAKGLNPAQVAVLQEQGFHLSEAGWTLNLSNRVLFANNVGKLTPATSQVVEKLGKSLLAVDLDKAQVDGHTDNSGNSQYNHNLSLQRAQSVADVLISVGMKPANIAVKGLGETMPLVDNSTPERRAENRRVAIVIDNQ
ncbi:MAG: OmpA family protein [Aeromonas sp.]